MTWQLSPVRRERLVSSICRHAATPEGRRRLQIKREEAEAYRTHPEWMWRALVLSFSTVQTKGDRVWKNVEARLPSIEFLDVVAQAGEGARKQFLLDKLDKVGYRFPDRFCGFLAKAVHRFEECGGPTLAVATLANASDAEKIDFFVQFEGISHKYARNMWMDVDPEALVNAFAIDSNIMSIIYILFSQIPRGVNKRGISSRKLYSQAENYLARIALDAGVSAWEADRLMYHFRETIVEDMLASA